MDVYCNRINFECTDSNLSFLTLILFKSMAAGGEFVGSKKTYVSCARGHTHKTSQFFKDFWEPKQHGAPLIL